MSWRQAPGGPERREGLERKEAGPEAIQSGPTNLERHAVGVEGRYRGGAGRSGIGNFRRLERALPPMTVKPWAGFIADLPDDAVEGGGDITLFGGRNVAVAIGDILTG